MYSLRYWYEKKHEDGKVIRLEIHKKNNSAAPMEIGDVVQGLSLNIDGGEDNIDAPIVSTSLVMTFIDAYDHHEAEAKKCGNWAEFYTPDATLWKVVLLCKDAGASSFRTLWGGYVTPDSYEDDLVYRGSVTIVARDNIGHLADFPFDAEGDAYGTISLRDLLAEAWIKIESPMALRAYDDWMQTEGVSALDTRLNVSAFKDKSWHEAIEAALYAYGASMRFIGNNEVMVSPLRYIANFGGSFTQSQPIFMTGATRMLTPAVKRIEETASYDLEAELQPLVKPSDFSGERTLLDSDSDIYGYYLSNTEEGKGWLSSDYHTIFFDPSSFGILEADSVENLKNQMYVVAVEDYTYTAEYSRYVLAQSAKVKVTFGTGFMRKRYTDANGNPTGGYYLVPRVGTITKAYFKISVTQNGVKQYLKPNGEWTATPNVFSKANDSGLTEMEHDIDLSDFTGTILLKVEIGGIVATIPYVGISAFSIGANEAVSLLQTNRVNTNYNEENNVIIKRDPVIAPAYNTTILPSIIKNGIFYLDGVTYKPAKAWAWVGGTPQQMAVYNHLQLLTFYAKPNNVIEGNIVNGDVSRFAHIWQFEGKEHILVSGRYNYINGFIEGAILREFARYENLWGSAGEAQLPATETNEETNRESSASSSSAASTYDNTTIVNIGSGGGGGASNLNDLQDVDVTASVAESVLYFNGTSWVDKTIHSLLAELKAIGDWFYKTDDGKSIGTKFNLFSEQEMSANGLSIGSGSSGGLISQVYGTTAFGTIASESNSATFNAYAIDSLYKRIVSLEGKATAVSFVPALTSGKQIGTLSIDGVSTVLYGVDAYSKTEADSTFLKLTGGEVKGYVNVSHDTQSIPLGVHSKATDYVAIRFTGGTGNSAYLVYSGNGDEWAVTPPNWAGSRILLHSGNFGDYAVSKAGGTITVRNDGTGLAISTPDTAWAGIRFKPNTASVGATLNYNGTDWRVTDDGWNVAYTLYHSGNLTKLSQLTDDVVSGKYLPLSGGSLMSSTIGCPLYLANTKEDWNAIGFKGKSHDNYAYLGLNKDGNFFVTTTGWTTAYTLLHSGNYSQYALPLTGGTISNGNFNPLTIKGNSTYSGIGFVRGTNSAGYLVYEGGANWAVTSENWAAGYRLIHSGNYNSYAPKLDGTGASGTWGIDVSGTASTLEKYTVIPMTTGTAGKWKQFAKLQASYQYHGKSASFQLSVSSSSGKNGAVCDVYAMMYQQDALGNAPIYTIQTNCDDRKLKIAAVLNYDSSGSTITLYVYCPAIYTSVSMVVPSRNGDVVSIGTELLSELPSGTVITPDKTGTSFAATKLITASGNNYAYHSDTSKYTVFGTSGYNCYIDGVTTYFRYGADSTIGITINSNGNTTIGSTGDLAGTRYKLYVNGSTRLGTVYLPNNTGIYAFASDNTNSFLVASLGSDDIMRYGYASKVSHLRGNSVHLLYGSSHTTGFILNSSGNVTIGSSDLASTTSKLYVDGLITSSGASTDIGMKVKGSSYTLGFIIGAGNTNRGIYDYTNNSWLLYRASNTDVLIPQGNVGIGTTSPEFKLHVTGNIAAVATDTTTRSVYASNSNGAIALLAATNRGVYDSKADRWIICSNGTNTWLPSGNVGIGTDGPAYKLHVIGTVGVAGTLTVTSNINISTIGSAANNHVGYMQDGTTLMRYNGSEYGNLILSGSGGAMYFRANGTTNTQGEMTLDGNGILKVMGRIEANAGVKVASGQALTFLDASGVEHKLTYDSTAGAFKFDGNVYATQEVSANGIGTSGTIETTTNVNLSIDSLMSLSGRIDVSQSTMDVYGLTTDVVYKMLAGKYNKILGNSNTAGIWDYDCWQSNTGNVTINLKQGDGININQTIVLKQVTSGSSPVWSVTFLEI